MTVRLTKTHPRWLITRLNYKLAATGSVIVKTQAAARQAMGAYQLTNSRIGETKYLSLSDAEKLARKLGFKPHCG